MDATPVPKHPTRGNHRSSTGQRAHLGMARHGQDAATDHKSGNANPSHAFPDIGSVNHSVLDNLTHSMPFVNQVARVPAHRRRLQQLPNWLASVTR